ncbi:MAG TPA: hypothetical protein VFH11_01725 [Gemmatimonadota bacterium]|nr:hypothetical protein [Gemmatimonadota bacterium]
MRSLNLAFLTILALAVGFPSDAWSQNGRADRRDPEARGREDGDVVIRGPGDAIIIIDDDDIDRFPRGRRGEGRDRYEDPLYAGHGGEGIPKFCRNGEGHPEYGMAWCFESYYRNENIPKYCRTGEGHPEFGRAWCVQEGYGLGSLRGVIFGRDRVLLDLEGEDDILSIRPSVWERIFDVLTRGQRRGR